MISCAFTSEIEAEVATFIFESFRHFNGEDVHRFVGRTFYFGVGFHTVGHDLGHIFGAATIECGAFSFVAHPAIVGVGFRSLSAAHITFEFHRLDRCAGSQVDVCLTVDKLGFAILKVNIHWT